VGKAGDDPGGGHVDTHASAGGVYDDVPAWLSRRH